MIDASCLFDSEEEEDDESKKKTPEERKFIFRRELRAMLYGFGDEKVCDFLENILIIFWGIEWGFGLTFKD